MNFSAMIRRVCFQIKQVCNVSYDSSAMCFNPFYQTTISFSEYFLKFSSFLKETTEQTCIPHICNSLYATAKVFCFFETKIDPRIKSYLHWCHSPCADHSVRSHNCSRIDVAENMVYINISIEFPGITICKYYMTFLLCHCELIFFKNLKQSSYLFIRRVGFAILVPHPCPLLSF